MRCVRRRPGRQWSASCVTDEHKVHGKDDKSPEKGVTWELDRAVFLRFGVLGSFLTDPGEGLDARTDDGHRGRRPNKHSRPPCHLLRHVEVLFVVRRRTLSLTASEPFRQIAESSQSLTVSLDLIRTSARKRNASRPHQAHLLTPKAFCHAVFGYRAY